MTGRSAPLPHTAASGGLPRVPALPRGLPAPRRLAAPRTAPSRIAVGRDSVRRPRVSLPNFFLIDEVDSKKN